EDYIDFNYERLLPHKFSEYSPALAFGDLNNDGLDDLVIGSDAEEPAKIYLQNKLGKFTASAFPPMNRRKPDNRGILLFDADGDGDLDIYWLSGGNRFAPDSDNYQDRLFINDGRANFHEDISALPPNKASKGVVRAADFDHDGDLDLFIGGRIVPGSYPDSPGSFLYRNDSKNGVVKFTDVTTQYAPGLKNSGLVCDAMWTDFDNDGWCDLIIAGEWMPVTFYRNNHGHLTDHTLKSGIKNSNGWWNSITAGDFDLDGDIDYIIGNNGENSFYKASAQKPVRLYQNDFDNNGSNDFILTTYLKGKDGREHEYVSQSRDELVEQLPALKKKFLTYKAFGEADFTRFFSEDELRSGRVLKAETLSSCYLENDGHGRFVLHALPAEAQFAPLNGMVVTDLNDDGNPDVAIAGNDYGNEITNGRYDAMNGLVMLGNGNGGFSVEKTARSGFLLDGNAKALTAGIGSGNTLLLAGSQHNGPLKIFTQKKHGFLRAQNHEQSAVITYRDGRKFRQEFYHGASFLSQSSRFISVSKNTKAIRFTHMNGKVTRTVNTD
ncbi:MAG: VCBS repeat-containing protein, partial [Mucilaginibacter polytrichastri]|nr:VCBS repeat-containing protein [Mucilaginibacter polytrichastri]